MKIHGLPLDSGSIKNVAGKKLPRTTLTAAEKADSVALSRAGAGEQTEFSSLTPEEFPLRTGMLDAVAERIAQNYYDTPETQENTAERIIDSLDISASVASMQNESTEDTVRSDQVESAKALAASGQYDAEETLTAVAERLTDALGLTRLLG